MERRRLNTEPEQTELPLESKRRRLALADDETVTLRMDKETAAAVRNNPAGAVAHMTQEVGILLVTAHGGYTEWSRERPPSSGYWELKQHSAREPDPHHWWYSPVINAWHRGLPQRDGNKAGFIPHGQLVQSHEWRGLRKPWHEGYSFTLEKVAFEQGVMLGNAASVEEKRGGDFDVTQLPDLNPRPRRKVLI